MKSSFFILFFFIISITYSNLTFGKKIEIFDTKYIEQFVENNELKFNDFANQCEQDVKKLEYEIKKNNINLGNNDLITYHLNSIICYLQTNNMILIEKHLLFIINEYKKNNTLNNIDADRIFKISILPFANQFYPSLNLLELISFEEIEEILLRSDYTTDIASKNLLIHAVVINLYSKNKKKQALKYLKKGTINKDTLPNLWSSTLIQGDYSLFTEGSEKIENNIKTIDLINEYLIQDKHSQLLWLKGIYVNNTSYLLRKQKKFDESLNFLIKNINEEEIQQMDPSIIQPYLKIYYNAGRLKESRFKDMKTDKKYGYGYDYFKKATILYFEKIIENQNYLQDITNFEENLEEINNILHAFLYSRLYYFGEIFQKDDSLTDAEKINIYWEDFNLSLKVNQILMTHEVGRSLDYLENKVYLNNKKTKKLFKEKIKYEDKLTALSLKLQNISEKNNDIVLSDYISVKDKINNIENSLKKFDYKYGNFFEVNFVNLNETIAALNEDEAIIILNKEDDKGYHITIISHKFSRTWYGDAQEEFNKITNFVNLKNKNFPYAEANYIYNDFLHIDAINQANENKIKHFIFLANDNITTFPFWLLLTDKQNDFSFDEINKYPWFTKQFSYSIIPSLNYFNINRHKDKWIIGVSYDPKNMNILKIAPNSNAEKYDFRIGDKIIALNNITVNDDPAFSGERFNIVNKISSTDNLEITLLRNNKKIIKKLKGSKNSTNPLHLPDKIVKKILGAKKYDFVGIGDPVLSPETNISQDYINKLFQDFQVRGIGNVSSLRELPSLPETRDELLSIQSNFEKKKTLLFLGEEANEIKVKKANLSNAKYIVFASHALTNGEIDEFNEPGIVLTPPKKGTIKNDGLLTASEIMNMDLNNTELVVLSACNTSAAKSDNSVALSGLAKSFFVAGAQSLIVSGWPVESESAAYLSSNMFKELMNNENISYAKALQLTINKMIDKNMDPLLWSPFMLIGDGY